MFDHSKLESLRDVSVTRIGDGLSYGFPHTERWDTINPNVSPIFGRFYAIFPNPQQ